MCEVNRYVVESPAFNHLGERCGTFRVYVATAERAASLAAEHHERSWRAVPASEAPAGATA